MTENTQQSEMELVPKIAKGEEFERLTAAAEELVWKFDNSTPHAPCFVATNADGMVFVAPALEIITAKPKAGTELSIPDDVLAELKLATFEAVVQSLMVRSIEGFLGAMSNGAPVGSTTVIQHAAQA